jgi:hypothetical protein
MAKGHRIAAWGLSNQLRKWMRCSYEETGISQDQGFKLGLHPYGIWHAARPSRFFQKLKCEADESCKNVMLTQITREHVVRFAHRGRLALVISVDT